MRGLFQNAGSQVLLIQVVLVQLAAFAAPPVLQTVAAAFAAVAGARL